MKGLYLSSERKTSLIIGSKKPLVLVLAIYRGVLGILFSSTEEDYIPSLSLFQALFSYFFALILNS